MSKLISTTFGVDMNTNNVDEFWLKDSKKGLGICCTSLKVSVINAILVSALWLFTNVYVGSKKFIRKCKVIFWNYLWSSTEQNAGTRINWQDCCNKQSKGELGPKRCYGHILLVQVGDDGPRAKIIKLENSPPLQSFK